MQPRFREPWRNSATAIAAPNFPAGRKSAAVKPDIRVLMAQRSKTAVFDLANTGVSCKESRPLGRAA
jgi:hypothetical protein